MTTHHPTMPPPAGKPPRTYHLTLRALPRPSDADDPDASRRLRAAVKALLRSYGLMVVTMRPVGPDQEGRADGR